MQQFKVGDHVIDLDAGYDAVVVSATGNLIAVEGYSTYHGRRTVRQYVQPTALVKVDDLVTGKFAPGDHVVVTGNEGRSGHHLAPGLDAVIVDPIDRDREYWVEGVGVDGDVDEWFVNECDLVSADEPTCPERIYKTGDRVLVTGASKCTHYLAVGTDAEVISDKGFDNWRPELYRVRGLGTYGATDEQWVHPDDLEAEPTFSDYVTFDYKPRSVSFDFRPSDALYRLFYGDTIRTSSPSLANRERALGAAVEMFGADTDGAKLVEVAEWLLSGKVPA